MPNILSYKQITSLILKYIISEDNEENDLCFRPITKLDISIVDFIKLFSDRSDEIWIVVLFYLKKIQDKHNIKYNVYNIHRYVAIAYIVSIKYLLDIDGTYDTIHPRVLLEYDDLYEMEVTFLSEIDWNLFIPIEEYIKLKRIMPNILYRSFVFKYKTGMIPINA